MGVSLYIPAPTLYSEAMTTNTNEAAHFAHSTRSWEHTHPGATAAPRSGCQACRWFEVELSVTGERGSRLFHIRTTGRSAVDGEVDKVTKDSTTSAAALVSMLALTHPTSGRRYLPRSSRRVLDEASEHYPAIGDALADFDTR